MKIYGTYFHGNKISDYGIKNGYVDYRTLARAFDAVLSNGLISKTADIGYWEQLSSGVDEEEIENLREQLEQLEEEIEELEEQEQDASEKEQEKERIEEEIEELENYYPEIFQYFIVDNNGAEILQDCGEIVFYNDELDLYIWGVTHWGTSWDYVLTNIKIEKSEE
jgi:myo-inositol-1-phosphate synthase